MRDLSALCAFARRRRIEVDWFPLEAAESLCVALPDGRCGIAIDPRRLRSSAEEKVKLGHELGHCVTGSFYNRWAACDVRRKHENRADKWAVEQFLSAQELDEAVAEGYTDLWSLAEYFGVTEEFMRKAVCWYTYGNLDVEEYLHF